MHPLTILAVTSLLRPGLANVGSEGDDSSGNATCSFDDRMNSLRCQDADWRTVRARLGEVQAEVTSIFVNFCRIRSLPDRAFSSNSSRSSSIVSRVSVVNSGLESVAENAFAGLEDRLEHLDLSCNRLETLPAAVLVLHRLVSLDLSRNRIGRLPHGSAFNNLNAIVSLDLSGNQ
jgi:Leucine-rich repeat (LRR) protein